MTGLAKAFAAFGAAGKNQRWSWSARTPDNQTVVIPTQSRTARLVVRAFTSGRTSLAIESVSKISSGRGIIAMA
jgi:hypothetical protein